MRKTALRISVGLLMVFVHEDHSTGDRGGVGKGEKLV